MSDRGGRIQFIDSPDTVGPCRSRGGGEGRQAVPGRAGGGAGAGHPISRAHSGGAGGRTPPCHLAFTLSHRKPRGFCAGSTRPRVGTEESTARKVGEPRAGAGGESGKGSGASARAGHGDGSSPSLPKSSPLPAPLLPREEQSRRIRRQGWQP